MSGSADIAVASPSSHTADLLIAQPPSSRVRTYDGVGHALQRYSASKKGLADQSVIEADGCIIVVLLHTGDAHVLRCHEGSAMAQTLAIRTIERTGTVLWTALGGTQRSSVRLRFFLAVKSLCRRCTVIDSIPQRETTTTAMLEKTMFRPGCRDPGLGTTMHFTV